MKNEIEIINGKILELRGMIDEEKNFITNDERKIKEKKEEMARGDGPLIGDVLASIRILEGYIRYSEYYIAKCEMKIEHLEKEIEDLQAVDEDN